MKKRFTTLLIFSVLIGFSACSKSESAEAVDEEIPAEETAPIAEPAANACDNPFYPLSLNNQWIYRLAIDQVDTDEKADLALTVSERTDSSVVLAALDYDTGIVTQSTVQCNDGEIVNFPVTELNMILGLLSGELNLEYRSGRFMPALQEFEDADWDLEWETEYTANGDLQSTYEGETLTALLSDSPVKMDWKVTGTGETLEVAAGKFENLVKVNRVISMDVSSLQASIEGSQVNIATTLTIDTNLWYAPRVGLIKQEIESASVKIYGINFPVEVSGAIELSEYTIQ